MPEYNNNEKLLIEEYSPTPDWLTSDYLQNILRKYFNDLTLKIVDINFQPATSKGENYASIMTRVHLKYLSSSKGNNQPISSRYIVKTSFEGDEFCMEKMLQYDVYNREMNIYKNILPKLTALLREINDDDRLFAEVIHVDYKNTAIIFEDLTEKSFTCADRTDGLDEEHTKIALCKLAKMHATSAVLNEREPELFKGYDRGMFNRHTEAFRNFFVNTLHTCGEIVQEWNEFRKYGEKILKLTPYVMEYGKQVFDVNENHFNVFAHGDYWTNNVMYVYDENKRPQDLCIIDFQFSCWGSPGIDLHYFLNTSMKEDLRLHEQENLLQYYYNILKDTLKKLKFKGKIPSLHEFYLQFLEKSFYAFTSTCIVQPVMLNEKTENADFHGLMGDDQRAIDFKRVLFENEKVQKNLKRLLPIFERRGLLDLRD